MNRKLKTWVIKALDFVSYVVFMTIVLEAVCLIITFIITSADDYLNWWESFMCFGGAIYVTTKKLTGRNSNNEK